LPHPVRFRVTFPAESEKPECLPEKEVRAACRTQPAPRTEIEPLDWLESGRCQRQNACFDISPAVSALTHFLTIRQTSHGRREIGKISIGRRDHCDS
jgi:hypothetical protein